RAEGLSPRKLSCGIQLPAQHHRKPVDPQGMRSLTTRAIRARGVVMWLCLLLLLIGQPATARADSADDRRALIMLRVLAYDKQLGDRAGDTVRLGILYPKDNDAEAARWRVAFAKMTKLKIDGRSLVITAFEIETPDGL